MARPAANLTAHFAPTPVSAAPGSAGREEAIWRPTTSRRLGPTSARQHRLAGKLVMHFVIMGSPLGGTEGSNPAPSSSQSVSAVNVEAVSEKPGTLASVCGWLGT